MKIFHTICAAFMAATIASMKMVILCVQMGKS